MIWWPTTQHSLVAPQDVHTIDSRSGEHFSILQQQQQQEGEHNSQAEASLEARYDGCASWWTQVCVDSGES